MEQFKNMLFFLTVFVNIVIINTSHTLDEVPENNFRNLSTAHWTSCKEFLANSTFDPQSIINVDWKIFYFWNFENEETYILRFSIPYPTLIDRFRTELHDLQPPVNWSNSVLFMETSIDFSALYISTETPGKFRIVPNLAFRYKDLPVAEFGLKLVYPGYLGILNCKYRFCYALAPVDKMPTVKNIHEEAQKLGFRGDFNRSYLFEDQTSPHLSIFEDDDIDRDPDEFYDDDGDDE